MKENFNKFLSLFIFILLSSFTLSTCEKMKYLHNLEISDDNQEKDRNFKIEEVHKAFQEVAYSYYMRGKNIQYNSFKADYFSPEEASSQNIKYVVCSAFAYNVYLELFNITIPKFGKNLLDHAKNNIGQPEVVGQADNQKISNISLYNESTNRFDYLYNPKISQIIPYLKPGDIFTDSGHVVLIYKVEKDDAIIIESDYGRLRTYVNSKIAREGKRPNGLSFGGINHYLYYSDFNNNGIIEGSIGFRKLSDEIFKNGKLIPSRYSVLRFIQKDKDGNAFFRYKVNENFTYNEPIIFKGKNVDRITFSHLFIEKTVNASNNNIVQLNDILKYTIIIKNNGSENYKENLKVTEYLSEYVMFLEHQENNEIISFEENKENKTLIWNLGELNSGQEIIINYTVKIIKGEKRTIIESKGFVGKIQSSTVYNTIGINLNEVEMSSLKTKFDELKDIYNGTKLIDEIYKQALNYNICLEEFDITKLINNSRLGNPAFDFININKNHSLYYAVLNNYWSSLAAIRTIHLQNNSGNVVTNKIIIYDLKEFGLNKSQERRNVHIYPETFKTGDILIYKNSHDITYSKNNSKIPFEEFTVTNENGTYSYIYIENKGFVGVNLGDDGKRNTIDDRNEFNADYYLKNKFTLFCGSTNNVTADKKILEYFNIQTLFGKDYYVILRPSLIFKSTSKINPVPTTILQIPTTQVNKIPTTIINQPTTQINNILTNIIEPLTTHINKIPTATTTIINQPTTQINNILTTIIEPPTTQVNKIPTTIINQPTTQINNILTTIIEPLTTHINKIPTTIIQTKTTQLEKIHTTMIQPLTAQINDIPTTNKNQETDVINNIKSTSINYIPSSKINPLTTQLSTNPSTVIKIIDTEKDYIPTTYPKMPTTQINNIPTTTLKIVTTSLINDLSQIVSQNLNETISLSTSFINPTSKITSSINNNISPIKGKVLFILQAQVINKKLAIFMMINFAIFKTQYISFMIYIKRNNRRNLQENNFIKKEIYLYPDKDYQENENKISSLISHEEVDSNNIVIEKIKNEEEFELKLLNDNSDILDTQKVEEQIKKGGMDFSKVSNDYKINQYKIKYATKGCQFNLFSENVLSKKNKKIELNFIELNKGKNKNIKAKCLLSSQNKNNITCDLNEEIEGNYSLEPYLYSDTNEIITIVQNNVDDYLILECQINNNNDNSFSSKKTSSEISIGIIIAIIAGSIIFIIIITIIICCIKRKRHKVYDNTISKPSEIGTQVSFNS